MIGLCIGMPLGLIYIFIKLYQVFANKYITRNKILLFLGVVGIALLAAQISPPTGWDLYRHYDEINRIREWGATYAWEKSRYANYYGATALFYLASLTPWNETLPFITVLMELCIFEKVISHYKDQISAQTDGICFFLFLVLSNIVMAISGIRNVLAVVLVGYVIWHFECVTKKHFIVDIVIVLFAITIHPASTLLILIYALTYIPSLIAGVGISIFILPALNSFLDGFISSENALLSSSSGLFFLYTKEQAGLDIRVRIVSVLLIIFSIVVILQLLQYEKRKDRYLSFILLYSFATLGMISQGLLYSRMLYGLNILYTNLIACYCYSCSQDAKITKTVYWYKLYCLIYCAGMLAFQGYELARAILIR